MKNTLYIIILLIGFLGNSQTPFPTGIRLPNATKSDTISQQTRIPILRANSGNLMNKYIDASDLSGYLDLDEMVETANSKILTAAERALIGTAIQPSDLAPVATSNSYTDLDDKPTIPSAPTGLEAIDEGNGIGYRIIGRNPANYGNIGLNALDFGTGVTVTTGGALGESSVNFGEDNIINSWGSFGIGYNNQILTNSQYSFINGYQNYNKGQFQFTNGANNYNRGNSGNIGYNTVFGRVNDVNIIGGIQAGLSLRGASVATAIFGQANVEYTGNTSSANTATDPILIVGNGDINNSTFVATSRSNALRILKNGTFDMPSYGDGTITGTATYAAAFDEDGKLIEVALGGGGGSGDMLLATPQTVTGTKTHKDKIIFESEINGYLAGIKSNDAGYLEIGDTEAIDMAVKLTAVGGSSQINMGDGQTNIVGDVNIDSDLVAATIKKSGGTSSQYLMADGSVSTGSGGSDTNIYNTDGTLDSIRSINIAEHSLSIKDSLDNPRLLINNEISALAASKDTISSSILTSVQELPTFDIQAAKGSFNVNISGYIEDDNTSKLQLNANDIIIDIEGENPIIGQVLTAKDTQGTLEWTTPSGGGGTDDQTASEVTFTPYSTIAATNVQDAIEEVLDEIPTSLAAANITVSPSISGETDAYAVMEKNRISIDSIQANMSGGINTTPRNVTSTAGVFSESYNESQPNVRLYLSEDTNISITGMNAGDAVIFIAEETAGTEKLLQFIGTTDTLRAYLKDELAYFVALKDTVQGVVWQRSYVDGKTDKVRSITGAGVTEINWEDSPYWEFTFGAQNDTIVNIKKPKSSKPLRLKVKQDATGSRTLAYAFDIDVSGGTLPTLTTTANATDVIHLFYDLENDRYSIEDVELNIQSIAGTPPSVPDPEPEELVVTGRTYNSSGHGSFPPGNSFDGSTSTYSSTTLAQSGWISIDFGAAVTVEKIELLPRQGGGTNTARINGTQLRWSTDGSSWTNIGTTVSGVNDGNQTVYVEKTFTPQSARYWGWINTSSATYSGNVSEAKFWGNE